MHKGRENGFVLNEIKSEAECKDKHEGVGVFGSWRPSDAGANSWQAGESELERGDAVDGEAHTAEQEIQECINRGSGPAQVPTAGTADLHAAKYPGPAAYTPGDNHDGASWRARTDLGSSGSSHHKLCNAFTRISCRTLGTLGTLGTLDPLGADSRRLSSRREGGGAGFAWRSQGPPSGMSFGSISMNQSSMARRDPGWLCYSAHATTGARWTRLVANAAQLHGSTALTRSEPQPSKRLHLFFGGPEISLYDLSIGAGRSGTAAQWPLSGRPADALGLKPATSLVLAQGGCGPAGSAGPDSVTAFRGVQGVGDERLVEVGEPY
ncbi:hypothetical protein BKA56DRAFT_619680 [Ilyonectria sp. MPI-CAGE-AT-0026]|nr:hypothetical protein BKA56DRAFT_619680 [Ilyonectria sp. MPI-CAGE-AT-0026]